MACEWIMDGISFQKIYGLCGLKGHIVEIRGGVTLVDGRRNVKIELEFWEAEFAMNLTRCKNYFSSHLSETPALIGRLPLPTSLWPFDHS